MNAMQSLHKTINCVKELCIIGNEDEKSFRVL